MFCLVHRSGFGGFASSITAFSEASGRHNIYEELPDLDNMLPAVRRRPFFSARRTFGAKSAAKMWSGALRVVPDMVSLA